MDRVLAVDLGGTKIAVGIVDDRGVVKAKASMPTPLGDPDAVVALALRMAGGLDAGLSGVRALGIALPGVYDAGRGVLVRSPSSGWSGVPFPLLFSRAFGLPATADNDVNCCALAEASFGAGRGLDPFFWMQVSTGIGGAVVSAGRVLGGANGMAGEIGHLVVRQGGFPCGCGNPGCLEAEAAGPAWRRKALALLDSGACAPGGRLALLPRGSVDARAIAELARAGDPDCLGIVDDTAEMLARGVAAVMNLLDPAAVFLGGGVAGAADLLVPRIEERLPGLVLDFRARTTRILPSALGYDAPLVGAGALALGAGKVGSGALVLGTK